jgi:cysteine desulfurase
MMWKKKRVYADAAASTPVSRNAQKELFRLLGLYGNPGALHTEALLAAAELDLARESVAEVIGAHPDEIVFTSGGTESNNLAIDGFLHTLLVSGEEVHAITSAIEHPSVLQPLRALREEGLTITELPVNSAGLVSPKELAEAVTENTVFVSVQLVNSEVGTVQPVREIAKELRRIRKEREEGSFPLYLHVDASQAPLWKKVQVDKLGVDLLTLDGQKILGPKGVGILYVRREVQIEPQQRGGGQERGLRSGTENVALAGSFAVALRDAQAAEAQTSKRIAELRDFLLQEILKRIPTAAVNGAVGDERVANNLSISIPGLTGEMAVIALDAFGVAASTRSACDSSAQEPSHVLVALGLSTEQANGAIRLTLLPTATKEEMLRVADALKEVKNLYSA